MKPRLYTTSSHIVRSILFHLRENIVKQKKLFTTLISIFMLVSVLFTPLAQAQAPLPFSDNFSSGLGQWSTNGDVSIRTYWGDSYARLRYSGNIITTVDTSCHQNINLSYERRTYRLDNNEYLRAQWRTGSSGAWTTREAVGGSSNWTFRNYDLGGAASDTNIQIRFIVNASSSSEYGYIDNVSVTGTPIVNNSIAGTVRNAANNTPLIGATVALVSGGSTIDTTTTNNNGDYEFTGLSGGSYTIRVSVASDFYPSSQESTVLLSQCNDNRADVDFAFDPAAIITGRVWYDDDRNGSQTGNAGIDGVSVNISGPVNASIPTSGNGYFNFSVPAGNYAVSVDEGTLPAGRTDLTAGANPTTNVIADSGDTTTVNFGYDDSGVISGRVWDDDNGNGDFNAGEPGLGWQITLEDSLGVATTLTPNPDGTYTFEGLPADTYTISVDVAAGWSQTNAQEHPLTINLPAGPTLYTANFGFSNDHAGISGYVWYDPDRNATRDTGEAGINGINVVLNRDVSYVDDTNTNTNGFYFFGGLPPGDYEVDVNENDSDLNSIWTLTTPDPQAVDGVVDGEERADNNFGFAEPPSEGKPLYLSEDSNLTRVYPPGPGYRTHTINEGANFTWQQSQALAEPLVLVNGESINASLRIDPFPSTGLICGGLYPNVTAVLRIVDGPTLNTTTIQNMSPGLNSYDFLFNLPPNTTIPAGARLALDLAVSGTYCANGSGYIVVYYDAPSNLSRLEIPTYSYLRIDSTGTYNGAYPDGDPHEVFPSGQTVYFRATVADPFGYDDISSVTLTVPGVLDNVAMTRTDTLNDATAIYQYAHTGFNLGEYSFTITAAEGEEGEVFAENSGDFRMIISDLTESYKEVRNITAGTTGDTAAPGDILEYTVVISNTGDANADAVYVLDPIPVHSTYIDGTVSGAVYNNALNAIVWDHLAQGTVPGQSEVSFAFQVQLDDVLDNGLEIENSAYIDDGLNPEPFPRSVRTTIVSAPNLDNAGTTKTVQNYTTGLSGDTAEPGDELAYTLTLVNQGNMNASATLRDVLPENSTLVAGTLWVNSGNAGYDAGSRAIQWNGTAPAGTTATPVEVTFRAVVDFPLDNGTLITNTVEFNDGFEINGTNPFTREVVTTITSEPLVEIASSKLVDEVTANPGDTLHYTIYLINDGKMNAPIVNLTDPLPENTSYAGGLYANVGTVQWDDINQQVTWSGPVNPGQLVEIRFRATAASVLNNGLVITNSATVNDGYHQAPFNLEAETTIISAPDLEDSYKTVSATTATPGQTLNYEIHLANTGNMIAPTQIIDTLSPNLVNITVTSPPEASYDSNLHAILWNGEVNPALPEVVIAFNAEVRLPMDAPQTIIYNTAGIDDGVHAPFDIFPPVQTTVNALPNLQTSVKAVSAATAAPGDELMYTITLNNSGNMNAFVSMQDIIPNLTTFNAGSLEFSSGNGSFDAFNNQILWEGLVAAGQPEIITYTVQIDSVMSQAETTIFNDARIDDGENTPFNTPGVTTLVSAQPELNATTKVVDLDEAVPGQQLWYRITIRNTGNMVAQGASVNDVLPNEVNYVSGVFPTGGGYNATGQYVYWNGNVTPGTDVIIDYYISVNDPLNNDTVIVNTAEISDGFPGHDPIVTIPDNAQTHITSAPNLGTSTKVVDKGTAAPGETLEYTITLNNSGNMNATNVTVVDTLPPNYIAQVIAPPEAVYDSGAGTITWNGLTVDKDNPVQLTFQVELESVIPDQTNIINEIDIFDGHNPTPVEDDATTIIGSAPNLQASTKTVDRAIAEPNDILEYTIVLRNSGNQNAANVTLTDVLPNNVTWAGWVTQNGANFDTNSETVTWNNPVNAGDEITFVYQVSVDLPLDNNTLIENTATIDDGIQAAFETLPAAQTLIQSTPNLLTSNKTVENVTTGGAGNSAAPGHRLRYTITLRNSGRMTAHNATMTDYLPDDVQIVDSSWSADSGSVSYTAHNRRLSWNGSVSPLANVTITYEVDVAGPLPNLTQIINDATIGDGIHSPFDTEPVVTTINSAPDLTSSTKAVNTAEAAPGDQIRYTITLNNSGNMVSLASLVDELPPHVTYFSGPTASSGSAAWDGFNSQILWEGSVEPETPILINYYVTVNDPTDNGTVINNSVDIDDGYPEHDIYTPQETVTTVNAAPNLQTSTKVVDKTDAAPDELLEYTLTLINTGNQIAQNATVTDLLPNNTEWAGGLSWNRGQATWNGAQVSWNGNVIPGLPVEISFQVRVNNPLDDLTEIINTATINDGFTGHGNISRQATTTIHAEPDLTGSTKTVDRVSASPGDTLDYTITLINTGSQIATGVSVNDVLPPEVEFDSILTPVDANYDNNTNSVIWTGDVTPGSPVVIRYRVTIISPLNNGTVIENQAAINDGFHTYTTQTAPAQTTIQAAPNLQTSTKAANTNTAAPGETIIYTITLNNSGNMNATAYAQDIIPANTEYVMGSVIANSGLVNYNQIQNRIEWYGTATADTPVIITYEVQVDSPLNNGTHILNTATIGDGVHSPFDTDVVDTLVVAAPNLTLNSSKTANVQDATPNGLIRYTITLNNDGNMTAGNSQIEDILPSNVTFSSGPFASSGSATWDSFNNRVRWSGAVAPNVPVVIEYDVRVNSPLDDNTLIENSASVNDGEGTEFAVGPAQTTIHAAPNLSSSTKEVNMANATPSDFLEYTITLINSGNMDASTVTLTDELPALTSFAETLESTATHNQITNSLEWNGSVPTGTPVVIRYRVQLDSVIADGTPIVNTAIINDGFVGHDPVETTEATTIVGSAPNLSTSTKMVNLANAAPGDTLDYTITLNNSGSAIATEATVNDDLPATVNFVGWTTQNGATYNEALRRVIWTGNVEPDAAQIIAYQVQVVSPLDNGTTIENVAVINNGVHADEEIGPAITTINAAPNLTTSAKTVNTSVAAPGQTITYTITLNNNGDMIAHGAIATDNIPNFSQYLPGSVTASSGSAEYQNTTDRIRWTGDVEPGTPVVIEFAVELDFPLDDGTQITNWATLDDRVHTPFETDQVVTTISAAPDLRESGKTVNLQTAAPGDELRYTITLINNGSQTANAHVDDLLPPEVTFSSGPVVQGGGAGSWDAGGQRIFWDGQVVPGETVTIDFYVTVNSPLPNGTIVTNMAQINDGTGTDPLEVNATTTVQSNHSLSLNKGGPSIVEAGGQIVYNIDYAVYGDEPAAAVIITDTIPANTSYQGCTGGTTCYESNGLVTWELGNLNPGDSDSVYLTVNVVSPLPDGTIITNNARIFNNDGASAETTFENTVSSGHGYSLTKSDTGYDPVQAGSQIVYAINWSLEGNESALAVVIEDTLPANTTFASCEPAGTCSEINGVVTWQLGNYPAGAAGTVTVTVNVASPLDNGTVLNNMATISDGNGGLSATATELTTVNSDHALQIDKRANLDPVDAGGQLIYTITYNVTGNETARNVVIEDLTPINTTFAAAEGASDIDQPPTGANGIVRWYLGDLEPNTTGSVTLTVNINSPLANQTIINNTALIDDSNGGTPDNVTFGTTVQSQHSFALTKLGTPNPTVPGGVINYTIHWEVAGNEMAQNVIITDAIPANAVFEGCGSCAPQGSYVQWNLGNRNPGDSGDVTLQVRVNDPLPDGTLITNAAHIFDTNGGTAANANTTTLVQSGHSLTVNKVAPDNVDAGGQLVYTINYNVYGDEPAPNVTITDTIPVNTSYVANSCTDNCTEANGVLTWNLGTLNPDDNGSVQFTVNVASPLPNATPINNTTFIFDDDNATGQAGTTTLVNSQHTFTIQKSDNDYDPVQAGNQIVYAIAWSLSGNEAAYGVVIEDVLPNNTTFAACEPAAQCRHNNGIVTWDLGNLTPSAGGTVYLTVNVAESLPNGTLLTNQVAIDDNNGGVRAVDNEETTINSDHTLLINKIGLPEPVNAGGQLEYIIVYSVDGNEPAPNVVIEDVIPANTSFASATGNYTPVGNLIRWELGDLNPGDSDTLTLVVNVDSPLPDGTIIENTVFIRDDDGESDSATEQTATAGEHTLSLTKSATPNPVRPDQIIYYTLFWSVAGNEPAQNVTITDTVPTNTSFRDCSGGCIQPDGGSFVQWNLGTRNPGDSGVLNLQLRVDQLVLNGTAITNQAYIFDSNNGTPANATATTTVESDHTLSIVKNAPALVANGEQILYTIDYTVSGDEMAPAVTITDTIPANTLYLNCAGSNSCSETGGTVSWQPGNLEPGASGTVELTVRANGVDGTHIINTAYIFDDDGETASDSATTQIGTENINIRLTDDRNTVQPGEQITYTIAFSGTEPLGFGTVEIAIPANTTLVDASAGFVQTGDTLLWFLTGQPAGFYGQRYLVVELPPIMDNNTIISTTASIAGDTQIKRDDESATVISEPDLRNSVKEIQTLDSEMVTYHILLTNTGNMQAPNSSITDTIPAELTLNNPPWVSSGQVTVENNQIQWKGDTLVGTPVVVTFTAQITEAAQPGTTVINTVQIDDGVHADILERIAIFAVPSPAPDPHYLYLPLIATSAGSNVADEDTIEVTIRNCSATETAIGAFWVDLYLNPDESSVHWPISHGEGYHWFGQGAGFVVSQLGPDQQLKLYLDDATQSDLPDPLPNSAQLYAQVDVFGDDAPYGVVYEGEGGETNNIASTGGSACNVTTGLPDLIIENIRMINAGEALNRQFAITPLKSNKPTPTRTEPFN